jgi:signal transduction histidine kinase
LYGETLLRHGRLPESERREFFRIITRESARLGRLIDQVLAVSRVDRSDDVYDLKAGDLGPVVAGIVDDYGEWLEQSGFRVSRDLAGSAPPVRFDAAALQQAVVNLLDNAAKYSGAARDIAVRLGAGNGHVTFEVQDHGIGIPPAEQQRVFDRFYRVANNSGKGGYGLGLFMVQHIMRAHGGRAEVESTPGRGSTFRLVFPVAIP